MGPPRASSGGFSPRGKPLPFGKGTRPQALGNSAGNAKGAAVLSQFI